MSDSWDPSKESRPSAVTREPASVPCRLGGGIRVIHVDGSNGNGNGRGPVALDAVGQHRSPDAPPPRHDRVGALIDAVLADQDRVAVSEIGDATLLGLLMRGQEVLAAALDLIRRRFPGLDVSFVAPDKAPDPEPCHDASVDDGGRHLGRLRSRTIPVALLMPQAVWLGSWLAMRDQHSQMYDAAVTDSLTGAYNRRFFDHFLDFAIDHAREKHQSMTVLVFDIDDFKRFNDQHGHGAGDEILRQTVQLLRSVIRPSDRVCRIGGDEFAVVFHEPNGPRIAGSKPPSSIFRIARRFQQAIADHRFPGLGCDAPAMLTVSGGLATYPLDGNDAGSLLARADAFALLSKRIGKNCMSLGPLAEGDDPEIPPPPPPPFER